MKIIYIFKVSFDKFDISLAVNLMVIVTRSAMTQILGGAMRESSRGSKGGEADCPYPYNIQHTYVPTCLCIIYTRFERRNGENERRVGKRERERERDREYKINSALYAITHKTPLRLCSHLLRKIRPRVRARAIQLILF